MALVTTKRNVDVLPGQAAPTVFHCSQHDVGATIILGLVNAGGNFSIPSGVTAIIQGSCSNGAVFTPVTATVSGSDITFNLSAEMTSIAGPTVCEAVLSKDTDVLGTANFILDVEESAMGSDTPPVFTDAAWLWMVDKMGSETVSALGDKTVIDAIESKLDKNQGTANAGKYLKVGADGNVETADLDVTTDKTLSIADKAADAKAVGDELDDLKADLNSAFASETIIDFQSATVGSGIIGQSTNKWNTATGNTSYFIPISDYTKKITITANDDVNTIFAFLKTDAHVSGTTPDYAAGARRTVIPAGSTISYSIPSDCRFITFIKSVNGSDLDYTPKEALVQGVFASIKNDVENINNEMHDDFATITESIKGRCISLWNSGDISKNAAVKNDGTVRNYADYDLSDFIDVSKLKWLYGYGARYCFYNEDKEFISGKTGIFNDAPTLGETGFHVLEIPTGAYYFRICELNTGTKQMYSPTPYDEYLKSLIASGGTTTSRKLYTLGDSITRGMYAEEGATSSSGPTPQGYPYWIGQFTGYEVVNLGNSGSGWANVGSAETAGDPSTARNAKNVIDDNAFTDADIITMAWGVNDWKGASQNIALGDMSSESGDGTVIGNMKYCIETLVTKKPTAQLIVLLPMNTNRQWSGMREMILAENWAFGYPYRNNQTLEDYRTAIRTCAEYYNVKVIDLEEVCPINRLNLRNVCGDGLHPTRAFYKQMGEALANLIC